MADLGGRTRRALPPPYFCRLRCFSLKNICQLTIYKTLDFASRCQENAYLAPSAQNLFIFFVPSHGRYAPFPKFLDPPLTINCVGLLPYRYYNNTVTRHISICKLHTVWSGNRLFIILRFQQVCGNFNPLYHVLTIWPLSHNRPIHFHMLTCVIVFNFMNTIRECSLNPGINIPVYHGIPWIILKSSRT